MVNIHTSIQLDLACPSTCRGCTDWYLCYSTVTLNSVSSFKFCAHTSIIVITNGMRDLPYEYDWYERPRIPDWLLESVVSVVQTIRLIDTVAMPTFYLPTS